MNFCELNRSRIEFNFRLRECLGVFSPPFWVIDELNVKTNFFDADSKATCS